MFEKLWSNSGDSHFLEPEGLWHEIMPKAVADRMPRTVHDPDGGFETVYVDGKSFQRPLPKLMRKRNTETGETIVEMSARPPGSRDMNLRLQDLDHEGVWAEVMYPSIGMWENLIEDRDLIRVATRAENEYRKSVLQDIAPDRMIPAAALPLLDVPDAVAELQYAKQIGLHIAALPTGLPKGMPDYNRDDWEPLWAAAEECDMVLGFHIGSDNDGADNTGFAGPGGAVLNYVKTTFGGQYAAMKLVTGGALDRHPNLKILISEGGATWVPFIGDRMNEGYRQHSMFVRPVLSRLPKEILYRQVYTSFQHDESAPAALWAMGYQNVMWGSDYPHLEGTYGHTQKTLHELFDNVVPEVSHRVRIGAFKELFPHISDPPGPS